MTKFIFKSLLSVVGIFLLSMFLQTSSQASSRVDDFVFSKWFTKQTHYNFYLNLKKDIPIQAQNKEFFGKYCRFSFGENTRSLEKISANSTFSFEIVNFDRERLYIVFEKGLLFWKKEMSVDCDIAALSGLQKGELSLNQVWDDLGLCADDFEVLVQRTDGPFHP